MSAGISFSPPADHFQGMWYLIQIVAGLQYLISGYPGYQEKQNYFYHAASEKEKKLILTV